MRLSAIVDPPAGLQDAYFELKELHEHETI